MTKISVLLIIFILSFKISIGQNFGNFPKIKKQKLHNDLEILYQGLDKFHSGMYWYTPKDSINDAFKKVKGQINKDINILEFNKLIAPLVALSREGHTGIYLPKKIKEKINIESTFIPLTFVFLGTKLYCFNNFSNYQELKIEGKEIIENEYNPDGYNIGMNCGEVAGQSVMHFHCHIIPRFEGDIKNPKGGIRHCVEGKGNY